MTTQTEALKLALEALNTNRVMAKDSEGNYTREITPKLIVEAIAAIKAALEAQRMAQPEKEPVASKHYYFEYVGFGRWVKCDKETYDKTPEIQRLSLYTTPLQRPSRSDIKPLTDEHADKILETAEKVDPKYAGWVRDQRRAYVRAGYNAAHGIRPTDFKE